MGLPSEDGLRALLTEGVSRGIISAEQAAGLAGLAREPRLADLDHDDERLRFITGFSDIFVTLGLGLFLGAAAWFARLAAGDAGALILLTGLAWGLAEVFTRRRRMALPSIALLVTFAGAAFCSLVTLMAGDGPLAAAFGRGGAAPTPAEIAVAALATVGLVALHYWRFRVPVTVAAGMAALLAAGLALLAAAAPDFTAAFLDLLVMLAGLVAFAAAMRFDLADVARTTRATDIAFWLHLLAAPLIVHPLLSRFVRGTDPSAGAAAAILAVFLGLAVVAVLIDRRAVLVSGLVYAGIAFATLVRRTGIADQIVPLTILALGAFVLLLSAGWHPLRRALLGLLPHPVAARLPHPSGS